MSGDVTQGTLLVVLEGLGGLYSPQAQQIFIIVFAHSVVLVVFMLPMNCYCRHVLIMTSRPLRPSKTFLVFGVACMLAGLLATWAGLAFTWDGNGRLYGSCLIRSNRLILRAAVDDLFTKLCFLSILICYATVYVASIYWARQTLFYIKQRRRSYSSKALSLQQQLTRIMIVQAIVPILTSVGPGIMNAVTMLLKVEAGNFGMTVYGLVSWIPFANPLATIIIIKPYRKHLLRMFGAKKLFSVSSSTGGSYSVTRVVSFVSKTQN
ncbi:unnamed protein product [Bursaphelenchus xylophilus]|uniref:(pine wood nematode) hypothetical protein n=1 Tax=Bursaphelenchus xylophilus TaxID=6326 RepID=A0A7I8X8G2_BURXY|nr:unnamed protein product [Bursaphelenchus xylophilus]CAG9119092.1 unnamed protein product [Bursaphelenchus xylophilus]